MGLATLPSASEGVLCVILVNTVVPFTIVRHLITSLLLILGIHLDSAFTSPETSEDDSTDLSIRPTPSDSYLDEFRSRTPAIRFDSVCKNMKAEEEEGEGHDCSVCLVGFEPDSEINHLGCGHVFHKSCLEQWLDYWNITCPLCRTPLVTSEEEGQGLVW